MNPATLPKEARMRRAGAKTESAVGGEGGLRGDRGHKDGAGACCGTVGR